MLSEGRAPETGTYEGAKTAEAAMTLSDRGERTRPARPLYGVD